MGYPSPRQQGHSGGLSPGTGQTWPARVGGLGGRDSGGWGFPGVSCPGTQALHPLAQVRSQALLFIKRMYEKEQLREYVEKFALNYLQLLVHPNPPSVLFGADKDTGLGPLIPWPQEAPGITLEAGLGGQESLCRGLKSGHTGELQARQDCRGPFPSTAL